MPTPATTCAFVIIAHRVPDQVMRLIDRLSPHPVFLHIDRGADPEVARRLIAGAAQRPTVELLPRFRSRWAGWGLVQATLAGLRAAEAAGAEQTFVMSGQDYPLVSTDDLVGFAAAHAEESCVASWALPAPIWGADGGMERIRYWHRPIHNRRFRLPFPRRFPDGLKPFGASFYCLLSRAAVREVLGFVDNRPKDTRFFEHVWMPEEMFVATVLLNSALAPSVRNENLWYIDWREPLGKHPAVLVAADEPDLVAIAGRDSEVGGPGTKLFARKFDADLDVAILDALDRHAVSAGTILGPD